MRISSFTKPALLSSLFLSTLAGCVPPGAATDVEDPALAANALVEGPASPGGTAVAPTAIEAAAVVATPNAGESTVSGTAYGIRSFVAGTAGTTTKYYLKDSTGKTSPLALTAAQATTLGISDGGVAENVELGGTVAGKVFTAGSIIIKGSIFVNPRAITGHKRFATLFCRFPELPSPASEDISFFNRLLGSESPGLRNYFSTASYGALDIDADELSFVSADFPDSLSEYLDPATGLIDNVGGLIQKCAEIANGSVYLPDYDGVIMLFSHHLGEGDGRLSFATSDFKLTNDNVTKFYRLAALTPTAFRSQKLTVQTVADSLGILKTTDSTGAVNSNWDLLSGGGTCSDPDPLLGCVAPLPAAPNRAIATWISSARTFVPPSGKSEIILDPADIVPASGHYGMARIPSATAGTSYSLEYRRVPTSGHGYERNLPGSGVIIHKYQTSPSGVVSGVFVDRNNNGNPNDAGSAYASGQFSSPADKLFIQILSAEAGGMKVRVVSQKVMLTISPKPVGGSIHGTGINCGQTGNDCSQEVDVGSTVQLSAVAGENSNFVAFVGCQTAPHNHQCSKVMNQADTVSANFEAEDPFPPICDTKPNLPQCQPQ